MLVLTTRRDVTWLHAHTLIQREAPWGLMLVAGVAAVGVATVELWVADGQVRVAVRVLRVPGLALPAGFSHTGRPTIVCTAAVEAFVI